MASHVIFGAKTDKPPFYFQDVANVCGRRFSWQFYCRTRKQSHIAKTQREVKLLQTFLGTRNELRKVDEIPALELNEYICEFIISVRTKDGKDYEPSSVRSLLASFEPHLKKEQLLCQYHEWPRIWENKKGPPVQTERVKEGRKRKQAKRFDSSDSGGQWRWVKTLLWYEYVVIYH